MKEEKGENAVNHAVRSVRCERRPVFFNREPALPDKATCNLSQLVLFAVSRFSGSPLSSVRPPPPLYFPSLTPFYATRFFPPYFAFPISLVHEPRIKQLDWLDWLCPSFAAIEVYNQRQLLSRNDVSESIDTRKAEIS